MVRVDLRLGGRADRIPGLGHLVADVAADEGVDAVLSIAYEGVGNAVLDGAQVDVRQRCLRHGGDDAGDAGKLVGQGRVKHDITGMGPFVRVHDLQPAEPFPRVQCEKAGFGEQVFVEYEVDAGFPVQRQVGLEKRKRVVVYMQGQVVLKQGHACGEQSIEAVRKVEWGTGGEQEQVEIVASQAAIGGNEFRVIVDMTGYHIVLALPEAHGIQEENMSFVLLGVDEVDARQVGIPVEHNELGVQGFAAETSGERLECFQVENGHGAVAEIDCGGRIHRVHAPQAVQLGDVVDAIAVDVRRGGDEVLLHQIAFFW